MRDSTRPPFGSPHLGGLVKYLAQRDASKRLAAVGTVLYAAAIGGEIKIGYTADVVRRLDHFRSETPCRLLAIRFGTRDDERAVHRSLRAHLAHGHEWYHPTPEVLALVNQWRADLGQEPLDAEAAVRR